MNYETIPQPYRSRVRKTDKRIKAAWKMFEEAEPDISTERLIAQVGQRCHVDAARVCEGMHRTQQKATA